MEEVGDLDGAIAERRAVLALRPVDRAVAHYQIARLLHLKGDHAAARSAVLAALEIAPNYEDALDLLLELRRGGVGAMSASRVTLPALFAGLGTLAAGVVALAIARPESIAVEPVAAIPHATPQQYPTVPYDGTFTFVRVRFNAGRRSFGGFGRGRNPGWAHDYPYADENFIKILDEVTLLGPNTDGTNVIDAGDPELHSYPIAYVSEPGGWAPTQEELDNIAATTSARADSSSSTTSAATANG